MSIDIKKTVDLLAKASGNEPIFEAKPIAKTPIFKVLLRLEDGLNTNVQRQISNRVSAGQKIRDGSTEIMAEVLEVTQIQ